MGIVALPGADHGFRMVLDLDSDLSPRSVVRMVRRVIAQLVLDSEIVGNLRVHAGQLIYFVGGVHATSGLIGDLLELIPGLLVNRALIPLAARIGT